MKSGLLLIDKPTGITSHDVVHSIRRLSSQKQVGHAGTLDPLATGLMVVLLGEATKLSDYILNGDKAYELEAQLGVRTDSGDIEGAVLETKLVSVNESDLRSAVQALQGEFLWPVPIYSAVKVNGQKLYEKARRGEEVQAPTKKMVFYKTELLTFSQDKVRVRLHCSKGSFVRTWVEQLGHLLGCGATVASLRRISSMPYGIETAVPLAEYQSEAPGQHWIPFSEALPGWPAVKVDGRDETLIRNGQIPYKMSRFLEIEYKAPEIQGVKVFRRRDGQLMALLSRGEKGFSIKRVFNIS